MWYNICTKCRQGCFAAFGSIAADYTIRNQRLLIPQPFEVNTRFARASFACGCGIMGASIKNIRSKDHEDSSFGTSERKRGISETAV